MNLQSKNNDSVEIICIGTELLLGDILNSNARWLAKELALLGLPHYRQTVVGDNESRLKQAVLESTKRSKILITTGGLGPTPDDLTTATIADAFKTPLEEKEEVWLDIQKKISTKSRALSPNNRKQAQFPRGSTLIPNPSGTAPGMIWQPIPNFTILTFPGVPSELKLMWKATAVSWLNKNGGSKNTFFSRVLKVSGMAESQLAKDIADLLTKSNPTVATYASLGDVKLRLTAKAKTYEAANALVTPLEKELRHRIGKQCYGSDNETLPSVVVALLKKRKESLAIAESCTGGALSAAITSIPGASKVFKGGVIAYSNAIKQKILTVSQSTLKNYGAVSDQTVQEMAQRTREKFDSDWSIAISGVAGPDGGTKVNPVGSVYMAIAGPKGCESTLKNFGSQRRRIDIQQLSVLSALDQLRLILLAQS